MKNVDILELGIWWNVVLLWMKNTHKQNFIVFPALQKVGSAGLEKSSNSGLIDNVSHL